MFLDKAATVITELVWLPSANTLLGPGAAARGPWQSAGSRVLSSRSPSQWPRRVQITQKSISCGPGIVGRWALLSGARSPRGDASPAVTQYSSQGELSRGDVLWGLACGIITSSLFWSLGYLTSLRWFGGGTLMEIMGGSRGGGKGSS